MPKRVSRAFQAVLAEHRARFDRVTQRVAPADIKKLYARTQASLIAKLRAKIASGRGDTMTALQHRMLLVQIKQGQIQLAQQLTAQMGVTTKSVQTNALRGLIGDITQLERMNSGAEITLPIEEASRFAKVIASSRPTLLRANANSMARYGSQLVKSMEDDLALSLASGETVNEAIDRVAKTADIEWWRGERIVRTETAAAFNATAQAGVAEAHEEIPDLYMRWSEHVDDASGAPLDDRVSVDSLAMNGQVALPGGGFTMPASSPVPDAEGRTIVPEALAGRVFFGAPCRPNGREVLQPWRPSWGIPGWRYVSGRRVPVTE